jgi:hypothetical protein
MTEFCTCENSTSGRIIRGQIKEALFALMSLIQQLSEILRTHGEVVVGAGIALAGTIIGALISFIGKFFEHRWAVKRERIAEKKRSLDRLIAAAQRCLRACSTYRGKLIQQILNREKVTPAQSRQFADEAGRIALLYVPECICMVEKLKMAEYAFVYWAAGLGEEVLRDKRDRSSILTEESNQEFRDHLKPLSEAVEELQDHCSRIAAKL